MIYVLTLVFSTLLNPMELKIFNSINASIHQTKRITIAKAVLERAEIESKRHNIDLKMMLAIGYIESNYQPWATRQDGKYFSVGIYQVLRYGIGSKLSRGKICRDGIKRQIHCKHWFSLNELKRIDINSYIAALEISMHVDRTKKRKRIKAATCSGLDKPTKQMIWIYGHYNSGDRDPSNFYLSKLCNAYKMLM